MVGVRRRIGQLARALRQAFFIDHGVATVHLGRQASNLRCRVANRDGQCGVRQVTVTVFDGVGEDVALTTLRARVAGVGVSAIGRQRQLAVGAVDHHAHRGWAVQVGTRVACNHAHHTSSAHGLAVRTEHVVGQYIAAEGTELAGSKVVAVKHRHWYVVHDFDRQGPRCRGVVVAVSHRDRHVVKDAVCARTGVGLTSQQGVAVGDHARGGVVARDGQRIAQGGVDVDRGRAATQQGRCRDLHSIDGQLADAVSRGDGEAAGANLRLVGVRRRIGQLTRALRQAFFINHGGIFTCCRQLDGGSAVANVDGQSRCRDIGIAVGERIGKYIAFATF